jgi:hypothetical protein
MKAGSVETERRYRRGEETNSPSPDEVATSAQAHDGEEAAPRPDPRAGRIDRRSGSLPRHTSAQMRREARPVRGRAGGWSRPLDHGLHSFPSTALWKIGMALVTRGIAVDAGARLVAGWG